MNRGLPQVGAPTADCKCCGTPSSLFGVVDFHKNCRFRVPGGLPLSGTPIYYHRCGACGFLFTTAMDAWTSEEFGRHIYNDEYVQVDPDFLGARPEGNAEAVRQMFGDAPPARLLDYGGGTGLLAERLRAVGFPDVATYDPFVSEHAERPEGRFDCIVSFEVMEHSPRPRETLADMNSLLADDGLIVFSTLVQGADFEKEGLGWWYVGPRNGHVSLHSRPSLRRIAEPMGFQYGSFNDGLHVLFRQVPDFARHLIRL